MTCPSYEKHKADFPRRGILKSLFASMMFWLLRPVANLWAANTQDNNSRQASIITSLEAFSDSGETHRTSRQNLGVSDNGKSEVYLVRGGSPEQNMDRLIDMLGGIENIIGKDDIVLLKPNAQWWSQGMTNTDGMKAFIDAVLGISGFQGEIIIADNHQYANPDSRAWTTDKRNGCFNYNELVGYFQERGNRNVTKYIWRGAGPNPHPLEGDDALGSNRVSGPEEGDGYVWCDDLVYVSPLKQKCMMTYPIFTSDYSGITIDFKKGAWKDGKYTGQPFKFINFSALNHHGPYCGVTASIKNYMGIVDMTCGFQGSTPKDFWNTHFIGLRNLNIPLSQHLPWRIKSKINRYNWKYFHHTGAALGMFMRDVRMADLNIITADWVGWGSRIRADKSSYPKTLLASIDPVALDYIASTNILVPETRKNNGSLAYLRLNDATDHKGPFYKFLYSCHSEGIGNIIPQHHDIKQHNITVA